MDSMVSKDDFKARNAAVGDAIKDLEDWRRKHLTNALHNNGKQWGIWNYEYRQLTQATRMVRMLLENLKDEDLRRKE